MRKRIDKIKYTIEHRKAIRKVYRRLFKVEKLPLDIYLHDLDKIIMTPFIGPRKTSKIHKKYSRHHGRASCDKDYRVMIADWESARFTKPDKQYNAFCTLNLFYGDKKKEILPLLVALRLDYPNMVSCSSECMYENDMVTNKPITFYNDERGKIYG